MAYVISDDCIACGTCIDEDNLISKLITDLWQRFDRKFP